MSIRDFAENIFKGKNSMRGALAFALVTFTMSYILAITFAKIPVENIRFADTILGFLLGTGFSAIVQFYFGTSQGSVDKNQFINQAKENENNG